ncbi:unnamed protein product [Rotaria sp. Silwood1]|nr:unnamed protein product [Rotaria sp. Silwood1]CAF0910373.1 unnamed protein product [Rotaria sp. Silwood1]CAF3352673.1 unnamed protein product [Rotaria sp. Silwood1]CAF3380115.1 unnamed protein product [Rotaria sp. Silwood1]CAF3393082.1 unnamed protein product [Rotaria sp. Silwood1]
MLPTLGRCEDPGCNVSSSHELVRLFRCSIHCDRNLCLYHLNAHNVYYEEEKKQNDIVICELQKCLNLYQTIFEQQILSYRDLVRQASTILLHNTSTLIPIDQIQTVIDKIQEAITVFQGEKIIIKCEPLFDGNDCENEKTKIGNNNINNHVSVESDQKVVVRIPRIDCSKNNIQSENEVPMDHDDGIIRFKDSELEQNIQSTHVAKQIVEGMKKKSLSLKRIHK